MVQEGFSVPQGPSVLREYLDILNLLNLGVIMIRGVQVNFSILREYLDILNLLNLGENMIRGVHCTGKLQYSGSI